MRLLGRAFDRVVDLGAVLASVILVVMMLATVVKVAMRYLFNHGILGIDQISGTMMLYITFLGAAWVLRREGHVTVDIVLTLLPERVQRGVQVVGSLVAAAACLTVAWFATGTVLLSIQRGILVAAEIEIPRAFNLMVIPLGAFLLGIEFLRRAMRFHRGEVVAPETPRMEA